MAGHTIPAAAVTLLTAAVGVAEDLEIGSIAILMVAVFSGQLVVGWTNDLIDRERDRQVGRTDKPLASGDLSPTTAVVAVGVAGVVCVVASLACGLAAAAVHLVLGIGSALAYNAGLKSTYLSWLPYFVAFGSLPVVVTLTADPTYLPPVWMIAVSGLLGVGAHLLNVMPDLDDDAATGITGLPHRLGARRIPGVAAGLLIGATAIAVVANSQVMWLWIGLGVVVVIALTTMRRSGRAPFYGAIAIAGVDVTMLLLT
ncbi:UbiA family prenyltransferase [Nocardia sp. 348MFTsu5.1]|uniref:UbiA family prenyltransferase n=1 Tax=Nocardia sp. 348MFTsu5.1 TaxID=1172185 RepID=UPI001E2AE3D8|nr:UbiA family prenyltransferase [Nocardia sp. 348MFTsu5.1]